MSSFSGAAAFNQWFNLIYLTYFSKSIYLFMPFGICIRKICRFSSFFMIIKIKYNKSACSVRQQRINPDYIRPVFFISQQVRDNFFDIQFFPLYVFTFITACLFSSLPRAEFYVPSVVALRKVTSVFAAFCINVLPPQSIEKKRLAISSVTNAGAVIRPP